MKRGLIIGLMMIFLFSFTSLVSAIIQPGPDCNIKGIIESSGFKEAWEDECIKQGTPCIMGVLGEPDRYFLSIKVEEVSTIKEFLDKNCEERIKIGDTVSYIIPANEVKEGDKFEKNIRIEAVIIGLNNRYISSYALKEKVEPEPIKTTDNTYLYLIIAIVLLVIIIWYFTRKKR